MTGAGYLGNGLKGERGRHHDGSKSLANQRPTKSLFVIIFYPVHTKVRDIERHFEPYGKVLHVRIRRNFAFVQFDTQEEATEALQATHLSPVYDRYNGPVYDRRRSPERGRNVSPEYGRYRSRSPIQR
ncbi:serine/arginine-rich splicing factor RS31A [Malus domestica]|uniref:serine/arginine-rich splicing factor RS31A n=1 Tax=Malus domestica TaxID=3750 RepID=UPI0039748E80